MLKVFFIELNHNLKVEWEWFYKKIIKIISIVLGSVVGAGFATGQEIYFFLGNTKYMAL